jgi:hypothetical protein
MGNNLITLEDQRKITDRCVQDKLPEPIIQRLLRIEGYLMYWNGKSYTVEEINQELDEHSIKLICALIEIDTKRNSEYLRSYFNRIPSSDSRQQYTFVNMIAAVGYCDSMRNLHGVTIHNLREAVMRMNFAYLASAEKTLKFLLARFTFAPVSMMNAIVWLIQKSQTSMALDVFNKFNKTPDEVLAFIRFLEDKTNTSSVSIVMRFFDSVGLEYNKN